MAVKAHSHQSQTRFCNQMKQGVSSSEQTRHHKQAKPGVGCSETGSPRKQRHNSAILQALHPRLQHHPAVAAVPQLCQHSKTCKLPSPKTFTTDCHSKQHKAVHMPMLVHMLMPAAAQTLTHCLQQIYNQQLDRVTATGHLTQLTHQCLACGSHGWGQPQAPPAREGMCHALRCVLASLPIW